MTVAGFPFVGLDGFTPVQAWNSCLEQRTVTMHKASYPFRWSATALAPRLKYAWPRPLLKSASTPGAPFSPYAEAAEEVCSPDSHLVGGRWGCRKGLADLPFTSSTLVCSPDAGRKKPQKLTL